MKKERQGSDDQVDESSRNAKRLHIGGWKVRENANSCIRGWKERIKGGCMRRWKSD